MNALYGVSREGTVPDFERKYLGLLRAGGTLRHKELLAQLGTLPMHALRMGQGAPPC